MEDLSEFEKFLLSNDFTESLKSCDYSNRVQYPLFHCETSDSEEIEENLFTSPFTNENKSRTEEKKCSLHGKRWIDVQHRALSSEEHSRHLCDVCGKEEPSKLEFIKHMSKCRRNQHRRQYRRVGKRTNYPCEFCKKFSKSKVEREYHYAEHYRCKLCTYEGTSLEHHLKTHIHQTGGRLKPSKIVDIKPFRQIRAFKGYVRTYRQETKVPYPTVVNFLSDIKKYTKNLLEYTYNDLKAFKSQLTLFVIFKRFLFNNQDGEAVYEYQRKAINSNMLIYLNPSSFEDFFNKCAAKIENTVSIFQEYGSGWVVDSVDGLDVRMGIYRPKLGSCGLRIPVQLSKKRCVVNVVNKDNRCFQWAVLASLHPPCRGKADPTISKTYNNFVNLYDFDCMSYPVEVGSIPKFESVNEIAINVFSWDSDEGLLPLHISSFNYTNFKTVDLLMITDLHTDQTHFAAITDIHGLLGKQNSHRRLLCYNCLQRIRQCSKDCKSDSCKKACVLKQHIFYCQQFKFQKIKTPKLEQDGTTPVIKFRSFSNMLKAGYVIYADFESLLKGREAYRRPDITMQTTESSTVKIQKHIPSGFSYAVVRYDRKVISHRVYRGPDTVDVFLEEIGKIADLVQDIYSRNVPYPVTETTKQLLKDADQCHICEHEFKPNEVKCIDHCHLTGKIRGVAHLDPCNLNFKQKQNVPVIIHNFRGYDSHFIINGFRKFGKRFRVTPTNSEKFMSVSVDNITFIDSLQFLNSSLDTLVQNLKNDSNNLSNFSILSQVFDPESVELLKRKGVYPYDYMDSFERFDEKRLNSIDQFYNQLRGKAISTEDYNYAVKLFKHFKMKNLGDFHDLYLLVDTLLLACVFENFRTLSLKYYKLDPAHYMSAPGLAWDAALKMTNVELEQLTDVTVHEFIELGIRGGVSMITQRKSSAKNKFMRDYVGNSSDQFQKYIMSWDMNNLYGKAMQEMLPTGRFEWIDPDKYHSLNVPSLSDKADIGYILECDLDYPDTLHNLHNDFPLAPEKITVPVTDFSDYQKSLLDHLEIKYMEHQTKLIPHLGPRKNYIVHYRNLKYYLEQGLILKKVHRILGFKQSAWLAPCIQFNTEKRTKAKNDFERDFFKLLNNAVYGKGMENKRKRMNIQLVNDFEKAKRLIAKPQYITHHELDHNLCSFRMQNATVLLDKAVYTGFAVLEISKLLMYQFHYGCIKDWYGENAKLLFTDTDSLTYEITTCDVYEDLSTHLDHFDTSEYPTTHPLYSSANKKVVGKMKDEGKGSKIFTKFVGLGAKAYCISGIILQNAQLFEKKALKGIPQYIQERSIQLELFEKILENQGRLYCCMRQIRSLQHQVFTMEVTKSALHGFDTKRFIESDGIHTLAWGHYKLYENTTYKPNIL